MESIIGLIPFSFPVGVTYSDSGLTATLHKIVNGQWKEYAEVDGRASYQINAVAQQYRGEGFNLGNFYQVYDWVA